MIRISLLIAAAAFGSDVGWQQLPEGGTEYIIQLSPYELDALRRHRPVESDVPRSAGEVRAYRIIVGTGILPREAPPPRPVYHAPPASRPTGGWPAFSAEPDGNARDKAPAARVATAGSTGSAATTVGQANRGARTSAEAPKPWLWLTATLMGLFASLGSNVYLGWIALDLRRRCRRLMTRRSSAGA